MKKSKPLGAFKAAIVALLVAGVSCFIFRQILLSEHSLLKKMEMTWMPYVMALLVGWVVFLYTSQVRVVSGSNSNQNSSK